MFANIQLGVCTHEICILRDLRAARGLDLHDSIIENRLKCSWLLLTIGHNPGMEVRRMHSHTL